MTYPEAAVADTIKTHFVPVQINTQEEAARSMVQSFHQVWTPDLRILSAQGMELYHWMGYLPPLEFLPQLLVAQGYACLALEDPAGAAEIYRQILERFPTSAVAPEAQYFLAVSLISTVIRRLTCSATGTSYRRGIPVASGASSNRLLRRLRVATRKEFLVQTGGVR